MKRLLQLLFRFIYERRNIVFYRYDTRQGEGQVDPRVQVYASWRALPIPFRTTVAPVPWWNAMVHRMWRGQARLLCYVRDETHLDAYGWIQDWEPFRKRFGAIAEHGTMLGFYWTAPSARGQGLYGKLLAHSLVLCPKDQPIVIATSPDNRASQHGIEKAGFQSLGEWELRLWFRRFSRMRRISGPDGRNAHGLS
jgi:RimJ/RimL family protein N-acetyltransferase